MGARKREAADARKEVMKNTVIAKLNNYPSSPRKMRLIADLIRGKEVFKALNILNPPMDCWGAFWRGSPRRNGAMRAANQISQRQSVVYNNEDCQISLDP